MVIFHLLLLLSSGYSEVRELSLEYNKYLDGSRFYELPNQEVKDRIAVNFNIEEFSFLYWNNTVHALTTPYKVSWIGWKFEIGILLFSRKLQLYYGHHSQHYLEGFHQFMGDRFPVNDSIGIRWNLIKSE